jgi:hypothetical protein
MPCSGPGGPSAHDWEVVNDECNQLRAMLCGVMSSLKELGVTSRFYYYFDEEKSGVTVVALQAWWKKHQEEDKLRVKREKEQRKRDLSEARAMRDKLDRKIAKLEKE